MVPLFQVLDQRRQLARVLRDDELEGEEDGEHRSLLILGPVLRGMVARGAEKGAGATGSASVERARQRLRSLLGCRDIFTGCFSSDKAMGDYNSYALALYSTAEEAREALGHCQFHFLSHQRVNVGWTVNFVNSARQKIVLPKKKRPGPSPSAAPGGAGPSQWQKTSEEAMMDRLSVEFATKKQRVSRINTDNVFSAIYFFLPILRICWRPSRPPAFSSRKDLQRTKRLQSVRSLRRGACSPLLRHRLPLAFRGSLRLPKRQHHQHR